MAEADAIREQWTRSDRICILQATKYWRREWSSGNETNRGEVGAIGEQQLKWLQSGSSS